MSAPALSIDIQNVRKLVTHTKPAPFAWLKLKFDGTATAEFD